MMPVLIKGNDVKVVPRPECLSWVLITGSTGPCLANDNSDPNDTTKQRNFIFYLRYLFSVPNGLKLNM